MADFSKTVVAIRSGGITFTSMRILFSLDLPSEPAEPRESRESLRTNLMRSTGVSKEFGSDARCLERVYHKYPKRAAPPINVMTTPDSASTPLVSGSNEPDVFELQITLPATSKTIKAPENPPCWPIDPRHVFLPPAVGEW